MKKMNFLTMIIVMLMGASSCKKDSSITNPSPLPQPQPQPSSLGLPVNERLLNTYSYQNDTYVFEYNPDKTIKNFVWNNGTTRYDFEYAANKVMATFRGSNGIKQNMKVFNLVNGRAETMDVIFYNQNGDVTQTRLYKYTYNAAGLLIRQEAFQNNVFAASVEFIYNDNGDNITTLSFDENHFLEGITTNEYDLSHLDKSGSFHFMFANECTGTFFPRRAKHVLVKRTSQAGANPMKTYTYDNTYDASGFITNTHYTYDNGSYDLVYSWQ